MGIFTGTAVKHKISKTINNNEYSEFYVSMNSHSSIYCLYQQTGFHPGHVTGPLLGSVMVHYYM